jgi:hypothetical protein
VFLFVAIVGAGRVLWDGMAHDGFSPEYFAVLYGTPLVATALSFLALRKGRSSFA